MIRSSINFLVGLSCLLLGKAQAFVLLPQQQPMTKYYGRSCGPGERFSASATSVPRLALSTCLSASTSEESRPTTVTTFRQIYNNINELLGREDKHFLESSTFVATPLSAAIASFFLYPTTSMLFHNAVNVLSKNNWEPVDGGQLQWSILLPALNGVVMTAISLLYANLISTTGTQLRNRQITVHSSLSRETEGVRGLIQLIAFYPQAHRREFGNYIQSYLQVLVNESDPDQQGDNVQNLRINSRPLSDFRNGLHSLSVKDDGNVIHGNILERSYETLQSISDARNARITSLQTRFPDLHYLTITALSAAILFIFLLETDRKVILFLDKFQIRLVWSLLVGTITAIYCIGIDLAQPFIGTYTVPAEQLLEDNDELLASIQTGAAISPVSSQATLREVASWQQETTSGYPSAGSGNSWQQQETTQVTTKTNGDYSTTEEYAAVQEPSFHQTIEETSLYEEYMRRRKQ